MSTEEQFQPPKSGPFDVAHAAARALIGSVPVVGSAAVELFGLVFEEPIARRRLEWMEDVAEAIRCLHQERGISVEDLSSNETFIDAVMQATPIAIRSRLEEKREALRAALINAAGPGTDSDRQAYFIRLVDQFSPAQLRLLKLFDDPRRWFRENNRPWPSQLSGPRATLLREAYPDLAKDQAYYTLLIKDLNDRGMMSVASLGGMITANGLEASLTTPLGREFMAFISAPPTLP